jgi:DNA-binding PadR family transcriptional regulator
MNRTATTANAILGLLALRPSWRTYDITKQLRRNMRFFWPRAESRIYDEAKQLVQRGLASAASERTGQRTRTSYRITEEGNRALQRWLATPPRPTALECEPLLRVFLADFCTRDQIEVALDQLCADAEAILSVGRDVGPEYLAGTAPFQDQLHVRALILDFLWSHAEQLRDWAEHARSVISGWDDQTPEERTATALAIIQRRLASDQSALP